MGAYNECFTSAKDKKYKANAKDPETGYPEWTFVVDEYSNDYSEAKSLAEAETGPCWNPDTRRPGSS